MAASLRLIPLVVLILVTLGADKVQAAAVCSNTPGAGDRIECTQDSNSTTDIAIGTENLTITTSGTNEPGIKADHAGSGNIAITSDSDSITTTGSSIGIDAIHSGSTGNVTVKTNGTTIQTSNSDGIRASTSTPGSLDVDITGVSITTGLKGVYLHQTYDGSTVSGPVTLDINGNASITTSNVVF